ncbi:MAG: MraY family glycosyltransferase [Anaerolineae bacterium]
MIPLAAIVFGAAALVAWATTPLAARLARRAGAIDVPRQPKNIHTRPIPRWGGLAMALGFFAAAALVYAADRLGIVAAPFDPNDWWRLQGVLLGMLLALLFGLWDDVKELSPWPQLVVQVLLSVVAIAHVVWIEVFPNLFAPNINDLILFPAWVTLPLTVVWIVGMMNTVNMLDGLDGLAAGVGLIAALLFAWHAYTLDQTTIALFSLALAGACLGFLPWNFHPAKIFMGTAGSAMLGFALATFAILAPAKVATALLVLGLPILDVAWLVLLRWRQGRSPFTGGRDHLHQRLYDLGLSQRAVVLLYYTFALIGGVLAFVLPVRAYKLYALVVLSVIGIIGLWALGSPRLMARFRRQAPDA